MKEEPNTCFKSVYSIISTVTITTAATCFQNRWCFIVLKSVTGKLSLLEVCDNTTKDTYIKSTCEGLIKFEQYLSSKWRNKHL